MIALIANAALLGFIGKVRAILFSLRVRFLSAPAILCNLLAEFGLIVLFIAPIILLGLYCTFIGLIYK